MNNKIQAELPSFADALNTFLYFWEFIGVPYYLTEKKKVSLPVKFYPMVFQPNV